MEQTGTLRVINRAGDVHQMTIRSAHQGAIVHPAGSIQEVPGQARRKVEHTGSPLVQADWLRSGRDAWIPKSASRGCFPPQTGCQSIYRPVDNRPDVAAD